MQVLAETYAPAIRRYFARCCRDPKHAEDLASGFIGRLIEKNRFRRFERREGEQFRKYLSVMLKNYFRDNPPPSPPIEPLVPEASGTASFEPGLDFDRDFARDVGARAWDVLTAAAKKRPEKLERLNRLKKFLRDEADDGEYKIVAHELGISELAVRQSVHRMRQEFCAQFRSEVCQTVDYGQKGLDDEVRYLLELFIQDAA